MRQRSTPGPAAAENPVFAVLEVQIKFGPVVLSKVWPEAGQTKSKDLHLLFNELQVIP
jgi:hypothetical protein